MRPINRKFELKFSAKKTENLSFKIEIVCSAFNGAFTLYVILRIKKQRSENLNNEKLFLVTVNCENSVVFF